VIRTTFRYLFRTILFILIFVFIWIACAIVLPFIKTTTFDINGVRANKIFIRSNGIHTDFVLPVKSKFVEWNNFMPYSDFKNVNEAFNYVSIGWGDKGFFIGTPTWADLKFSTAFNAAFGLSSTAMHVTYKRGEPVLNENCRQLFISDLQYSILIKYITSSFQRNKSGFILIDHSGYSDNDRFYEANGTYSLFKTCNVWTGTGLQIIGEKTGAWTPLSNGILQNIE
jgi:uncharacterized protein (TIGR02117 family)